MARQAFGHFTNCFACQTFWTVVAIYALTRGMTDPAGWFFSAAAYSGAAVLLSVLYGSGQNQPIAPTGRKPGGQNCGN